MNKRTVILIAICCLLAVATVTMRYIEQEIAIIRAKFVGDKRTEERIPRGIGSVRPAPSRTPQNDKAPAAVKQNAVRPPGPGVRQSPPTAAAKVPAARTVITTTAVVPGKNVPVADAVRETGRAVPVEDVTTPLEPEPAAVAHNDAPVSERGETAGKPDAAAPGTAEKMASSAEAPQGADAAATSVGEGPDAASEEVAAGERGGMRNAAVEGESNESQGEAIEEEDPAPVEENEDGEEVAADEEPSPGAEEPAAEPEEEAVDEE